MLCIFVSFNSWHACFYHLPIRLQNQLFREILSEIPSECQKVWIQIRHDVLSGLMLWVQTLCKGHQQTTLVGEDLNIFIYP